MDICTPYSLLDTKNAVTQTPILHYPDPVIQYKVYMQMHQMMPVEHNYHKNMVEWNF